MAVSQNSLNNEGLETQHDDPDNLNQSTQQDPAGTAASNAAPAKVEDDIERDLRLAQEEQARIDAGKSAAPDATQTAAAEPAASAASAAPAATQDGKAPPGFVPIKTAIAERDKRQQAEQKAAYWQGQAEARAAAAPQAPAAGTQSTDTSVAPAPPAGETPDQAVTRIREERLALAEQYDQGAIRTKEWEQRKQELEDQEWNIRQQSLRPVPQAPIAEQSFEERETQRIEQAYPILNQLAPEDLNPLVALAYREAAREGKPITANVQGTIALRERVAKLAQKNFGTGAAPASTTTQQSAAPAQHRNSAAADLAVHHPVDVSTLGAGAQSAGMSDDQALAAMSGMNETEQIAFMNANPAIVNRAMQRSTRA